MKKLLLLFAFFPALVFAQQSASISGYVKNVKTGETLIAANVGLLATPLGSSSNRSGFYSITQIDPGSYTLVVSYVGYQTYTEKINLSPGEDLRLTISLKLKTLTLEQLTVTAERNVEELQTDLGISTIPTELITQVPTVFQADVFRTIQLLPGVKASSDYSSSLYIRGGSPDQTLILLDKTTVYNPTHFFGFFSTFNPDAIKDIKLYKGAYPAKYGGRLGSVLTIYSKDGNRKEFAGTATIGLLSSRATVQGPYSQGSYILSIRRSTLEPVLAILRQSIDNIPSKFYFYDVNGKINLDINPDNTISLAFYAGQDRVDFSFAEDSKIKLNYGNQTISLNWSHVFSQKAFSDFTFTGSHYFSKPKFNIATTGLKRPNTIYDFSTRGDIEYYPSNNHKISTGFEAGVITLNLETVFDGITINNSRIQAFYSALYAQDEWEISNQWKLTAGLRLGSFSEGNYIRLAPRLKIAYQLSSTLQIQAAYGQYYQYLTRNTAGAITAFSTWFTTGKKVPPAYGDQFVLGLKKAISRDYIFNIGIYYRTMRDLFDIDPFLASRAGLDYEQLFRFGKGYAYGFEFLAQKRLGRFKGFLGYTFSITRRKYPDFNEPINKERGARFFPPKFNRIHDFQAVLSYKLSNRWSVSTVFNYSTGQAYTKPLGRTAAVDIPTQSEKIDQLIVGKVNASRLPAYNRLDIGFTRKGTFFGIGTAFLKLQIINAYSRRNAWFYNYDLNENPIEVDEVPMLPIIPNISYTVNF